MVQRAAFSPGDVVGVLTIQRAESRGGKAGWVARCRLCGGERWKQTSALRRCSFRRWCERSMPGRPSRCARRSPKLDHPSEYGSWAQMKARCLNPRSTSYDLYGGRGIRVCARWERSFWNFLADMGKKPGAGYSIDRIDGDGDYTPENCRWADARTQGRNTRTNQLIEHQGRTQTIREWAEEFGVKPATLRYRLKVGWNMERALTAEPRHGPHPT